MKSIIVGLVFLVLSVPASAGVITSQGSVTALTNIGQLRPFVVADFDLPNGPVPSSTYSS